MEEYRLIGERLEKELLDVGKEKHYRDLIELIDRIADYITTVLYTYCIGRQENLSGEVYQNTYHRKGHLSAFQKAHRGRGRPTAQLRDSF